MPTSATGRKIGRKRDPRLRENRNGPVRRDHTGTWGTTWTLARYLRRQPNFRGLPPRPPQRKISNFFSRVSRADTAAVCGPK
jgi:hypothetical protein